LGKRKSKEKHKLAQTIDYEEDKEDVKPNEVLPIDKPIYESSEGPVIKGKKTEGKSRYNKGMGSSKVSKVQNRPTNVI